MAFGDIGYVTYAPDPARERRPPDPGVTSARAGLYFAAGPDDGLHGAFGVITAPATEM
jgi:hypothetical protein